MANSAGIKYLIIGNSAGGIGAAEAIRQTDKTGAITIISEEPYPAYSRPMISDYLADKCSLERMLFRPTDFYEKNKITTIFSKKADTVDAVKHNVHLADGTSIKWDKLLLATGGTPIVPPTPGSKSTGVFSFTTLDDAKAIDRYVKEGYRAVVIGGGLIGVSVTEALVKRGVKVAIIEMKDRILNMILDEEGSAIAAKVLEKNEVKMVTCHTVKEIRSASTSGNVEGVTLDDGTTLPCEMVIVAIGVRPRIELVTSAGIKINRGIVVDRLMRTSNPDIYACGDAAEAYDFIYNENRVTPIWPNAYIGGTIAGFNMAGKKVEYAGGTTMNSIKYFGLSMATAGMALTPDSSYESVTCKNNGTYKKVILKDGCITGLIFSGDIHASGIVYGLMKDKVNVAGFKQALVTDDFSFVSLPEELWRKRLADSFKKPKEGNTVTPGALR